MMEEFKFFQRRMGEIIQEGRQSDNNCKGAKIRKMAQYLMYKDAGKKSKIKRSKKRTQNCTTGTSKKKETFLREGVSDFVEFRGRRTSRIHRFKKFNIQQVGREERIFLYKANKSIH